MASRAVDLELYVLAPIFGLAAAVSLGIVGPTLFGIDMGATLWSPTENINLALSELVSIAALVAVFVNRDGFDLNDMSGIELWAVYVTLGLVLAPPFIPVVEDTILQGSWPIVAWIVQTTGFGLVSYLN